MPHAAPNAPGVNVCCQIEANLKEIENRPILEGGTGQPAGALVVYQCQVCQRKHYVHEVAPISISVIGSKL